MIKQNYKQITEENIDSIKFNLKGAENKTVSVKTPRVGLKFGEFDLTRQHYPVTVADTQNDDVSGVLFIDVSSGNADDRQAKCLAVEEYIRAGLYAGRIDYGVSFDKEADRYVLSMKSISLLRSNDGSAVAVLNNRQPPKMMFQRNYDKMIDGKPAVEPTGFDVQNDMSTAAAAQTGVVLPNIVVNVANNNITNNNAASQPAAANAMPTIVLDISNNNINNGISTAQPVASPAASGARPDYAEAEQSLTAKERQFKEKYFDAAWGLSVYDDALLRGKYSSNIAAATTILTVGTTTYIVGLGILTAGVFYWPLLIVGGVIMAVGGVLSPMCSFNYVAAYRINAIYRKYTGRSIYQYAGGHGSKSDKSMTVAWAINMN